MNISEAFKGAAQGIPSGIQLVGLMEDLKELDYKRKKRSKEESATQDLNKFLKGKKVFGDSTKTLVPDMPETPKFGLPSKALFDGLGMSGGIPDSQSLIESLNQKLSTVTEKPSLSQAMEFGQMAGVPQERLTQLVDTAKAQSGEAEKAKNDNALISLKDEMDKRTQVFNQNLQNPVVGEIAKPYAERLEFLKAQVETGVVPAENMRENYNNILKEYSEDLQKRYSSSMVARQMEEQRRLGSQALQTTELSQKDRDKIGAAVEANFLLGGLVNDFKTGKYGGASNLFARGAAAIPIAGQYIAPEADKFANSKKQIAEVFLRAATGAQANDTEVDLYAGFLPDINNPNDIAQKRVDMFAQRVKAKAKGTIEGFNIEAKALEDSGFKDLADQKRNMAKSIESSLNKMFNEIPRIVEGEKELQFKSVEEAEAANLPKGTVIYINGRKAVVE